MPGSEIPRSEIPGGGSADEVRAVLTSLTEWARRAMPAPPSGRPGPECQWCPLCQLASALRGEYPELNDRLAEAGAAVTGMVHALLESVPGSGPPPTASEATEATSTEATEATADERPRPRPRPRADPDGTA